MDSVTILGVRIERVTEGQLRQEILGYLHGDQQRAIAKVNAEFLVRSLADEEFRSCLNSSDLNIADGVGVVWAARFLTLEISNVRWIAWAQILWQAVYSLASLVLYPRFCRVPIPQRFPGVEALHLMLGAAEQANASVYFLGASDAVNLEARRRIAARYPDLRIAGGWHGYSEDQDGVIREIDEAQVRLLIVALGSPRQEYWIRDNLSRLRSVRVAVGEGGSLDFVAGEFRRAPRWMQRTGLEWSWRLFMNRSKTKTGSRPRRVWNAVAVFIQQVVAWKLSYGATIVDRAPVP